MAMRRDAEITERARVDQQPHFVRRLESRAQQVVAGFGELQARPEARAGRGCVSCARRRTASTPSKVDRLAVERAGLRREIGAIEQHRAGGDQRDVRREPRLGGEPHHVAVVARRRSWAALPATLVIDARKSIMTSSAPPVDRREVFAARARRQPGDQQEIEHEGLVARRPARDCRRRARSAGGIPLRGSARQRSPQPRICGHSGQVEAATYTPAASPIR